MKHVWILRALAIASACAAALAETPPIDTPVAVINAVVIRADGVRIDKGTILIEQGRIVAVGREVRLPPGTRRIDADGAVAYPGFVSAFAREGVIAPPASEEQERRYESWFPSISDTPQAQTVAANRLGIHARRHVRDLLTIEDKTFAKLRSAGFAAALLAPPRAIFGGEAAVAELHDGPVRDALLTVDVAQTASFAVPSRKIAERSRYPGTLLGVVAQMRQVVSDARWYARMREYVAAHPSETLPPDADLTALARVLEERRLLLWEADSADEIHRVLDLCEEFGVREFAIVGAREAYKVIDRLKASGAAVILTLNVPPKAREFKIETKKLADEIPEHGFGKAWRQRPFYPRRAYEAADQERQAILENARLLEETGVRWCLSTNGVKKLDAALATVHEMIEAGVSEEAVLRALTSAPAALFGAERLLGDLAVGRRGDVTILSKPLAEKDAKPRWVIVGGRVYEFTPEKDRDRAKGKRGGDRKRDSNDANAGDDSEGEPQTETAPATSPASQPLRGIAALRVHEPQWPIETDAERVPAFRTGGSVLLAGATVLTVSGEDLANTSVLIENGKITKIGRDLTAPPGVRTIDLRGYVVMPGIFDPHSHAGISAVNEWTMSVTCDVRIRDVLRPEDPTLFRALAGGVTAMHCMHGSANTIGGQNAIIKLKYGRPASEMLVFDAPRTVKFALGENVKRSGMRDRRFGRDAPRRFPGTRMGVETVMRRALTEGRSYALRRAAYERAKAAGEDVAPFRRDVRLEALADILDGDIWVNCHCYRADEILRLLAVAEDFGFRIAALHHVLEGYRVMPEIARHGCGTATFADWWAYKIEAYEAVPQNAGMMLRYGINSTIKSDSGDLVRHMNMEAAKCMHASDLTPNEALRLITLNPARLFGLDDRLGSIEVGKDGDIAVFDGHPLDSFSRCVMTLVEGEVYFTHSEFDPDDPPAPQPIRSFDHAGAAWKDAKGKTPLTINARDDAVVETDNLSYAIINGTVHPVSGPPIAGGVVLIDDGKIRAVGRNLTIPAGATVVDATGLHVWPGLINAGTTLGMHEIGQVSVTVDTNEPGTYQPDVRAVSAVNPHSAMIEVTRAAGVTTAVVLPGGPTVAGQAGVIHLSGWTLPEMLEESEIGLVVSLPSASPEPVREVESSQRGGHAGGGDASDDEGPLVELEEFIRNARLYAEAAQSDEHFERIDPRYDAMIPYVLGQRPVLFTANSYKQILEALMIAERHKLRPVILGGRDAWKLADILTERDVPVIYEGVFAAPARVAGLRGASDAWDGNYRGAGVMARAGVKFCFAHRGADLAKLLPLEAGFAVAHGLDPDVAMRAMTLTAAEILGLDGRLGSLDPGKLANVIVTTDHPCQATSKVVYEWIAGRMVSLESKHTRNARRFANRPEPNLPPARDDLKGPPSQTRQP